MKNEVQVYTLFSEFDISLFKAGKHYRLYEKFGSHLIEVDGVAGTYFAVWAPSAKAVSVIGDFNYWIEGEHPLNVRWDESGIWEGFIPKVKKGAKYKYKIHSQHQDVKTEKADPYAKFCEHPPATASIVWDLENEWKDKKWLDSRASKNNLQQPASIYEVHLSSWRRTKDNKFLTYAEMGESLVNYVSEMGFTHVEFMPVMEYPYDPSWGYQITGFYAPTSRFGEPQDFMNLVEKFHQAGISVILDWVPSHFPDDAHGPGMFDGTHLYEHPDKRKGYHPDWKSLIFNYGRNEVRSFLISNAIFWLDKYHIDGLRVDAVASMLYLDYSRKDGEWEPNELGGRENLDAVKFLKDLNTEVYASFDGVQTIAEESTSFPMVSRPVDMGGLGFGMKWMMGWMHDTLMFFKKDPVYRKYHQNEITFSMTYAFTENFTLPLSHDEVVYGKGSILGKMPGDEWQRFANLRLLYGFMFTHPGTKLLFMGSEFGQSGEWDFDNSLDWHLLEYDYHKGVQNTIKDLNALYTNYPALYEKQFNAEGFEWISYEDHENSVISYLRKGKEKKNDLLIVCNFTPVFYEKFRIGIVKDGTLEEVFNSDDKKYSGSGAVNKNMIKTDAITYQNKKFSAEISIAPLAVQVFKII